MILIEERTRVPADLVGKVLALDDEGCDEVLRHLEELGIEERIPEERGH